MSNTDIATDSTLMTAVVFVEATEDEANSSNIMNNNNGTVHKNNKCRRLVLYRVVLVSSIAIVAFLSGAIFSCRAFDNEDFLYGYRGFIKTKNTSDSSGELCTSWEEHDSYNPGWYKVHTTFFHMGIAAVVLSVMALAVWITKTTVCVTRTESSSFLLRLVTCRYTFAVLVGASGILSFVIFIGGCDNIPPLAEGGVDCHLSAWTALGFYASISA
eukprot:scaffold1353_cov161-Amphora_coffeaeformis.AAC.40